MSEEVLWKKKRKKRRVKTNEKYSKNLWMVLWAKAVKTKSKLFEQASGVEQESNNPAKKNHKSFPVKYQLVGVFCLLLLDMLSSRRGLVAAQVCRQERRQETLEETAPKYGVLDIWNEPWMESRHCGVQLLQLNHYIKCKCKGSLNLLISPLHNSPTLCKCCHSIALRTNMTLSSNMTDYSAVLRDQANLRWWLACRYRSS